MRSPPRFHLRRAGRAAALRLLVCGGLCGLGASPAAVASLSWEQREVNLGVQDPSQEPGTLVARFAFTNTGREPVEILSMQPSCSCTVAELPKQRFAPGERGEIVFRFEVGELTGVQEKTLRVETSADGPDDRPVTLRLRAEIPESARVRPAFVLWTVGAAGDVKTLNVEAPGGNLEEVRVESSTADVTVEPRVVQPGRRWELAVRPAGGTERSVIATLRVVCRFRAPMGSHDGKPFERTFKAYAAVKPAPPRAAGP